MDDQQLQQAKKTFSLESTKISYILARGTTGMNISVENNMLHLLCHTFQ